MNIETLEDILNNYADMLGVYGACKTEDYDGCDNLSPTCCRCWFMAEQEERIRTAIANEEALKTAGIL